MRLFGVRMPARIAVVAGLLAVFAATCHFLNTPGDPWVDVLVSHVYGHDTRYAPAYSEGRFWSLHPGMTMPDVEKTLGPPLEKIEYDRGNAVWWYSESPRGLDYWMRAVVFRGGKTVRLIDGFYLD